MDQLEKNKKFIYKLHGLRGFAVFLVLLFHFFKDYFPGGYLGVDLFFILSGYLVMKSVYDNSPLPGSFTEGLIFLKNFYTKRFARIVPMAVFAAFFGLTLSLLFTSASQVNKQLLFFVYSILGLSNIKFFQESSNYFSGNQEFNFFTQTWSLAVEEQFYLIFSILILVIGFFRSSHQKKINQIVVVLTAISFLYNIFSIVSGSSSEARFYLLPFRLWELSIGILVLTNESYLKKKIDRFLNAKWENLFFFFLCSSIFLNADSKYIPFPLVLSVILPGIFLLLSSKEQFNSVTKKILLSSFFQYLGTISYSLYLIHWGVYVFIRHSFSVTVQSSLAGLFLSFFISHFTFKWVEEPCLKFFRRSPRRVLGGFVIVGGMCFLVGFFSLNKKINKNLIYLGNTFNIEGQDWSNELKCNGNLASIKDPYDYCLSVDHTTNKKAFYLLGDSHAAQMYFMFDKILNKDKYELKYINTESDDDVYGFARKYKYVKKDPKVFEYVLKNSRANDVVVLTYAAYRLDDVPSHFVDEGLKVWKRYINLLKGKDVKIIVVRDSPLFDIEPVEVCPIQAHFFGNYSKCLVSLDEAKYRRRKQDYFFDLLNVENNFDLLDYLCTDKVCSRYNFGELLYFDHHHYTKKGSQKISGNLENFLIKHELL